MSLKQHTGAIPLSCKPWWRRWKFWLAFAGGILAAVLLLLGTAAWLAWQRNPFPSPPPQTASAEPAAWWETPAPLTDEEIAGQRWLSAISWQLPPESWGKYWNIGGSQHGVFAIRYQAAFSGYAAAALGMRTPAYPALTGRILENLIERILDRRAWRYIGSYWKDEKTFPDPVAVENIMYSGHLLQLMTLHEAMTGDTRYRTEGFDFVWDAKNTFHYDTMSLAEVTVKQMRDNECGGVACEPGLVFFPCNNHPQIALRILEGLGLGDWSADRNKWEKWALTSYHSVLGGGAVKFFYHLPTKTFIPRGHPALDAWSVLWFVPWASNPATAKELWKLSVPKIDWKQFDNAPPGFEEDPVKERTCCSPVKSAPSPVASALAAAARACGDSATAERLEKWLDGRFLKQEDGKAWLESNHKWRIVVTANRLLARAIANGSDLRGLVQRPLPRDYFQGPLLADVEPADAPIFQAHRSGGTLIIELDGGGRDVALRLANVRDVTSIENLPGDEWSFADGTLKIHNAGRVLLKIATSP